MRYHSDSFEGDLAGGLVTIGIIVTIIAVFLMVKAVVFVLRTFAKYSDTHRSLWLALLVCGVLSAVGILLATHVSPSYSMLPIFGMAVLLITCSVVELKNCDTLLRPNVKLVNEMLHTSWWGSEDTTQNKTHHAQLAA